MHELNIRTRNHTQVLDEFGKPNLAAESAVLFK